MNVHELLQKTFSLIDCETRFTTKHSCADACHKPILFVTDAERLSLQSALGYAATFAETPSEMGPVVHEAILLFQQHVPRSLRALNPMITLAHLSHSTETSHTVVCEVLKKAILSTAPKPLTFVVNAAIRVEAKSLPEARALVLQAGITKGTIEAVQ